MLFVEIPFDPYEPIANSTAGTNIPPHFWVPIGHNGLVPHFKFVHPLVGALPSRPGGGSGLAEAGVCISPQTMEWNRVPN